MLQNFLFLGFGFVLLCLGSEWIVKGAASLALSFSIHPLIIGLTIVAFATSAPELFVSLIAAISGSSGVSLGNIIGSNVCNIGLVIGISAMIRPLKVDRKIIYREIPYLIGTSGLFWLISMDGRIGRMDGIILLAGLALFIIIGVVRVRKFKYQNYDGPEKGSKNKLWFIFLILIGMAGLIGGAHLIVKSAIYIARQMGLSEIFIGLTIVAIGTSLPELATSVVAGIRGEHDISIGNVVGSNIFNVCLVIGTVGLFNPMPVNMELMQFEFPAMFFLSILFFIFARTGFIINRLEGFFSILGFLIFIGVSCLRIM